jgi:hypothetical protein
MQKLTINSIEIQLKVKAKPYEKCIDKTNVKYLVYPNGKAMVYIACSENPFKLETEAYGSILFAFFDRAMILLNDLNPKQSMLLQRGLCASAAVAADLLFFAIRI